MVMETTVAPPSPCESTPQLVIVDVCGTLVLDDTTLGLLRFHLAAARRRRWRLSICRLLTSPIGRSVFLVMEKLSSAHLLKACLLRMLAGDTPRELRENAAQYAKLLLAERRVLPVWELLEKPLAAGRIVLASASIEPIVEALAGELGVPYVASELEVQAGLFTGRLRRDLTGDKLAALNVLFGEDLEKKGFCAVSDNLSDRALLLCSQSATVVLHKRRHLKRWGNISANFIDARR